jgi:hypothetical protein
MTVDVPDFDENAAYDPDRPISGLIRTQLLHLHQAESLTLPPARRTNININDLHTEREASQYIQKATALLQRHGKTQSAKIATTRRKTKKTAKRRATKVPAGATKKHGQKRPKPGATALKRRPAARQRKSNK